MAQQDPALDALFSATYVSRTRERWADAEPILLSGFATVSRQTEPGIPFLQNARTDLARVYDTLGRADEAERWRAEHAQYVQP